MITTETPILVLHALGDSTGGTHWREAITASGWSGPIIAPDLPGHGQAPTPIGGNYDLADPAFVAARIPFATQPVVVGVGPSGWAAQILALGGRAAALVLVDGLGTPWLDPGEAVETTRALLRTIADDPASLENPAPGSADPRVFHGFPCHGSRALAERAAAATPVPTLLVETSDSASTPDDRRDLAARFPRGAEIVESAESDAFAVARHLTTWLSDRTH